MNERMHRYVDGELPREALTPQELQEIAACEGVIREMGQAYRSIEVPDLTARVMARLPAEAPTKAMFAKGALRKRVLNTLEWFWMPRLVRFRPVYGILVFAVFLLFVVLPGTNTPLLPGMTKIFLRNADADHLTTKVFVQFRLDAPQASVVRLAGSFTRWEPVYTLEQVTPGVWSILIPLEPGVHDYAFVVDGGKWMADPAAPAINDGFGGVNSRLSVLLPNENSRL